MKIVNQLIGAALLAISGAALIVCLCIDRGWRVIELTEQINGLMTTLFSVLVIQLIAIVALHAHRTWLSRQESTGIR